MALRIACDTETTLIYKMPCFHYTSLNSATDCQLSMGCNNQDSGQTFYIYKDVLPQQTATLVIPLWYAIAEEFWPLKINVRWYQSLRLQDDVFIGPPLKFDFFDNHCYTFLQL